MRGLRRICYNERELAKGEPLLRRLMAWMTLLLLVGSLFLLPGNTMAEDWGFVVEDEEEDLSPDPRRQAWALMRRMTDEEKIYQLFLTICK